ncbi:M20 family metallopeptidase [Deinococcus peraridilitoris]|uniref:Amidohydrolase n=1 Tax=Deinococcus peraridilitoris (strain DSM 19664 / LMG 22246 / CIP 109416 / KR-200) TaxID=937777 RepID=L0A4I4_DEIPD|nr:M20 family metallopeptidase [Deinococcus peraridilitoris]AFZ68082.1 amidohydrolase [Deinococcus peraridilitoris DSM 19664]
MTTSTTDAVAQLAPQVVAWRRHLHQHPELAFQEHRTAEYVEGVLRSFEGLQISRPTPTSVLAVLKGEGGAGRTVLLRADMDALPIHEENDFEFASKTAGVMHACGHDGHTAMLLGAAKILSERRAQLQGELRFIFQHAEELFPGGAQQVVDAGVMDGVDLAVGAHLYSSLPTGLIAVRAGATMAAPDTFEIVVRGKGGHGAHPEQTVDPVVIGAQIVTNLQHVVSRYRDPLEPMVVSVTQFHAGTADNVIPDVATLGGTVRTFDAQLRENAAVWMERVVKGITEAHGARYSFRYQQGYRALHNDPVVTGELQQVVHDTLGEAALVEGKPTMGGEDFSAYLTKAPGAFFFVGAGNEEEGISAPHHHPRFTVDERALEHGMRVMVGAAMRFTQGV